MRHINWSYWRTFLAVIETGSLSSAAKVLQTTQPTVGRHIDELEAHVGGALFSRSQKGLLPTPLASSLRATAEDMSAAAYALERRTKAPSELAGGTVRITASEIVGVEILPAVLASFRAVHPEIRIELVLSNEQSDLLSRNADIAVRMTPPVQERLVRTKLGSATLGLYGAAAYFETREVPKTANQVLQHELIGIDRDEHRLAGLTIGDKSLRAEEFSFCCDSDIGQLAALRAGMGIGVVQCAIADVDPHLVRVLPRRVAIDMSAWLAMHEDLRNDPLVDTVFQHLKSQLRAVYRYGVER